MWMLDPTMFEPDQLSNQFSNYNNAPLPGPSYNTGAGGPVSAATGLPIASFQAWQAANPGGMNINATPAQPQAPQQQQQQQPGGTFNYAAMGQYGPALQELMGNYAAAQARLTPQQQYNQQQTAAINQRNLQRMDMMRAGQGGGAFGSSYSLAPQFAGQQQPMAPAAPQAGGGGGGAPNNWMAVLNALSRPGNPVTPGATVPMAQGFQPAGGVNQAFLGQAPRTGGNRNFLSALNAIQGRPQTG
jgi:hypothetical protein